MSSAHDDLLRRARTCANCGAQESFHGEDGRCQDSTFTPSLADRGSNESALRAKIEALPRYVWADDEEEGGDLYDCVRLDDVLALLSERDEAARTTEETP